MFRKKLFIMKSYFANATDPFLIFESNFFQPGDRCVSPPGKPRPKITIPQSLETGRVEKAQAGNTFGDALPSDH